MTSCHACVDPIWSGPCICKTWCKSRACEQSFYKKMRDETYADWASSGYDPSFYFDRNLEQRLAERNPITREQWDVQVAWTPGVPELRPNCTCTWCREVVRTAQNMRWNSGRTHFYGVRDSRGRFIGEVDNTSPYPSGGDYDT